MKNNKLIYLILIILFIWCIILTSIFVNHEDSSGVNNTVVNNVVNGFSTDITKVVENIKANTVTIETTNSTLSGVIYSSDETGFYVVTAYHGVNNYNYNKVILANYQELDAEVVGYDIYNDIAVLKVNGNLMVPTLKFGNSEKLKDGEFLVTLGTPKNKDYASSAALGMVASKLRTITNSISFDNRNYDYYSDVIQISADVSIGYSGSPVFNMAGELVGIITMKDDNAVFAVPVNELKLSVENILSTEPKTKIHFGIKGSYVKSLTNYERNNLGIALDINNGLFVSNVKLNSLASSIGLKAGDIVLTINNTTIESQDDLLNITYSGIEEFNFHIIRNSEEIDLVGSVND